MNNWLDGWIDGWTGGWMGKWVSGWLAGWMMDEWIDRIIESHTALCSLMELEGRHIHFRDMTLRQSCCNNAILISEEGKD